MVSILFEMIWSCMRVVKDGDDVGSSAGKGSFHVALEIFRLCGDDRMFSVRDSETWVESVSGLGADEVKWWKATVAGSETLMGTFKVDEGSFSGGHKGEGLTTRVFLSFYFRISTP
ncbi:hypothetical protein V6N13_013792 [Hibiscus sabdariffa]